MYLLDTNHCSRLLDGHPTIVQRLQDLGDVPVATCVVVQGELMFMAQKSERREYNLRRVEVFLRDIDVYPLDSESANIYGHLKARLLDHFGPRERARRRKASVDKLGFKENDLWIAAIARRHSLIVVSADSDFERIKEVDNLVVEKWWSPQLDQPI